MNEGKGTREDGREEEGEHEITDDKKRVEGRRETKEWICSEGGERAEEKGKSTKRDRKRGRKSEN